jgi:hypothetical protein
VGQKESAAAVRRGVRQLSAGRHEVPEYNGQAVVGEAGKHKFSWAYWEFCSSFGVYDPIARVARATAKVLDGWQSLIKLHYIGLVRNNRHVTSLTKERLLALNGGGNEG